MSVGLVVIKAVGNQCNLRCRYCYASPHIARQRLMSNRVLEATIKAVASLNPLPIYFWGGGEPLLAGRKFFERVLDLQALHCKHQTPINSLQTNGLLLNDEWLAFLKQYNFQVGISWDGPQSSARITLKGESTSQKVWQIIQKCVREGLNFGVITVATKENVGQLPVIAKNLYLEGIRHLLFKPYVGEITELSLTPTDWSGAVNKLLGLWLEVDDVEWILQPCYSFIQALRGESDNLACDLINDCHHFLTIGQNGAITCCDFASQRLTFGNVLKSDLGAVLERSPAYQQFVQSIKATPKECSRCDWRHLCGGGCLHYREFDPESKKWGKYSLCEARKEIFRYYLQRLSE